MYIIVCLQVLIFSIMYVRKTYSNNCPLNSVRKDGYKRLPIQVGAQDQFQLGCFTWADGWLFDNYRWSAGFPNLNYSPTYDMGVDIYASLSYNNTLNNKYYTTGLPAACREVKGHVIDYILKIIHSDFSFFSAPFHYICYLFIINRH